MKKVIRIYFTDFSSDFNINRNFFTEFLSQQYTVIIDPNPDYLFYSCFGYDHFSFFNCIKIYYTGENLVPDFNICDYALGFHHLEFEDRYLRFPFYLFSGWDNVQQLEKNNPVSIDFARRKFCNFVYSNQKAADPFRLKFFEALSKYKKVDSGGRYKNNIGGPIDDKKQFIKEYKFTIAIENSAVSGYTTEKIFQPMIANSIPIYYGDPKVSTDFNVDSFVAIKNESAIDEAIEEIIYLDQHDDAYINKLSQPWFAFPEFKSVYQKRLSDFFDNIFNQTFIDAKRTPKYGYASVYQRDLKRISFLKDQYWFQKISGLKERLSK